MEDFDFSELFKTWKNANNLTLQIISERYKVPLSTLKRWSSWKNTPILTNNPSLLVYEILSTRKLVDTDNTTDINLDHPSSINQGDLENFL